MPSSSSISLPGRYHNLDGLRGVAALMVVVAHIESHKTDVGISRFPIPYLSAIGGVAVTIFFVLSGFIITRLLLAEKETTGAIHTRNFYMRRVLRILPLYFVVLIAGSVLFAGASSFKGILLSVLLLPNLAYLRYLLPPILYPIWSIGVEEQFYAIHPLLLRFVKQQRLLLVFVCLALTVVLVRNLFFLPFLNQSHFFYLVHNFFLYARFDSILAGCIAALYFKQYEISGVAGWVFEKPVQLFAWFFMGLMLMVTVGYNVVIHELYAPVAAILVLNLCRSSSSVTGLSAKPLLYLGKVSYGWYLTHKFVIFLVLYLIKEYGIQGAILQNIILYPAVLAGSIGLAGISFRYFETYFLAMKQKYR